MMKFRMMMALAFAATAMSAAGEAGAGPAARGVEAPAAAPPVLGGDLPGLSGPAAIALAVARFNAISQFAAYEAFTAGASYNWAYASEGRHYVESYTWVETCGAYVSEAGVVSGEFCYLRIGI